MRKVLFFVAVAAFISVGYALGKPARPTLAAPATHNLTGACAKANLKTLEDGKLTLGTDTPAFPPWWDGHEKKGTGFKLSNPYSGKGYESAVAYEVARRLGFTRPEVKWTPLFYVKSYAPGKKPFDFYLAQISYKPIRARAVDFSISYYFVNQAVVALKGKPITKAKSLADLKPYKLGAPLGTTSYDYIVKYIKPTQQPAVFDTLNDAVTALKNGQIDGLVADFPSTGYITGVQIPNSIVVGRLPTQGTKEHFGLVLQKGNPLVTCVNRALRAMWTDGTMKRLQSTWLAGSAPLLKK
jgi:polar amino acid transport system substrate-binding protein